MAATFSANQTRFEEVETRMTDWRDAGYPTPSGVDTFYHSVTADERSH
ncbi:MAG: hypothetical protein IIA44_10420, partial [Acidobacteria bacterium]|nr:hypothetical protein [Acidobacteriota bacterium]